MGNDSGVSLDRDRAFDMNSLNELLIQGRTILTEAVRISEEMEKSITAISEIYDSIDPQYRTGALGADIQTLSGKVKDDIYQETMERMDRILLNLINEIPACDSAGAKDMDAVEQTITEIQGRIRELQSFFHARDIDLSYQEFKSRLEDMKSGWDETAEDWSGLLVEIENDVMGTIGAGILYSPDPVNLSTGNFVYDHEDLKIGGEIPLSFHRYYNAKDRYKGSLGRCFVHNYDIRLDTEEEKGKVTVTMSDGQKKTFRRQENGGYLSSHSALEILTEEPDGWLLETLSGSRIRFHKNGRMTRMENQNGRGITFSYDEKVRLIKAITDTGSVLTYSYNETGQLACVSDHTGRNIILSYERGKLSSVTDPAGNIRAYRYGKNGRIEETINFRGTVAVKNSYDQKRRVIRQDFPDGGHMDYTYDDGNRQVIMTERNGTKTTYVHDGRYRCTDIVYEDGTTEHFAYNKKNQRIRHTDRNGRTVRCAYDNRGNLTQFTGPLGEKLSITYNTQNNPLHIKIGGREKQKNVYDKNGNLLESIDALLRRTTFTYNEKSLPETITKPDGSILHFSYDEKGDLVEITNALGGTTLYAYDALHRVTKITDPKGAQTCFTYDEADHMKTLTNAVGDVRTYEYNASGRVVKITDFDGSIIERSYNALNKLEKSTDQLGRITEFYYDAMWNLAEAVTPDGAHTRYRYDADNRLSLLEDTLGNTISYAYDGNGNCISRTDQTGNTVRFFYDASGRLIRAEGEEGSKIIYVYNEEGRPVQAKDAFGNTVNMEYDEAGQLIKETGLMGETRTYTYTPLGKMESVTDEAGLVTFYSYLPGGKLKEAVYSDGTKESYTYDVNGNVETHTNQKGFVFTYEYDCLGRVTGVQGSNGEKKEYAYDALGNVTSVTDVYGNSTCYEYSPTGQLTKITDALGNETVYTYDLCDRLTEIRQYGEEGACHVTAYKRDLLGRIETAIDPLGQKEHYTYDAKGQLLEKLDQEGYLTKYGYTAQGDISRITYADGREAVFTYNPLRQLIKMQDWSGTTKIENDAWGRALKVQYPDGRKVSYTYRKRGERTGITYPDGRKVSYIYDEQRRLTGLKEGDSLISYAYDELGRLSEKTFPNGCETLYAYDGAGHLAELIHRDGEGILDHYLYRFDLMGNKTAIEKQRRGILEESGVYTYAYDALGRLKEVAKDGQIQKTYSYDAFGNRRYMTDRKNRTDYTYNAMNQLLSRADSEKEERYAYDGRGNLRSITENGVLKNQYTYGALNRLEQAFNGQEEVSYTYNGLGHRVEKTIGNEYRIQYLVDLTKSYHNLLQKEEKGKTQTYLWDGNVTGMAEESGWKYILQDELGSPVRLLDESGESVERYGYDEFGQDLYGNQGTAQPFGYTGYQYDRAAGTYYAQAREYRAEVGRFASEDRVKGFLTAPGTLHEYVYCLNSPLSMVDWNGRTPGEWIDGPETDYEGVYYLNAEDGAFTFGHAALLFVRYDGSGTFYSFAASQSEALNIVFGNDVPGYLSKAELEATDVDVFLGYKKPPKGNNVDFLVPMAGKINTDGIDRDFLDGEETPYTRYIYIPVTVEEGKIMSYYAEQLRDDNRIGIYNLYARNCGMVAQDILRMGGKNFAAGSGDGKNRDEQLTMAGIAGLFLRLNPIIAAKNAGKVLIYKVVNDYLDQTIPDGAYYKGWLETQMLYYMIGWETGKIIARENKNKE